MSFDFENFFKKATLHHYPYGQKIRTPRFKGTYLKPAAIHSSKPSKILHSALYAGILSKDWVLLENFHSF